MVVMVVVHSSSLSSQLLSISSLFLLFYIYIHSPFFKFQSTLLPRLLQKGRQRRLVSVEIHCITQNHHHPKKNHKKSHLDSSIRSIRSTTATTAPPLSTYEECIVRILYPHRQTKKKKKNQPKTTLHPPSPGDDDDDDDHDNDDDESIVTISPEFIDTAPSHNNPTENDGNDDDDDRSMYPGWRAKYRFPIRALVVKGTRRNTMTVEIVLGKKKEVREILFDSIPEMEQFANVVRQELVHDQTRTAHKMQVAMGTDAQHMLYHLSPAEQNVTWLVELVSAWDLPAADFASASSDPFIVVILDGVQVHKTDYISKTLDPIWTIATGSLFLLSNIQVPEQLFRSEGLLCIVYDFDKLGANDALGAVTIPPQTIYHATGERMEFPLGPPPGKIRHSTKNTTTTTSTTNYGTLAVRIRRATEYDIEFMNDCHKKQKGTIALPGMKQVIELDDRSTFHGGKGNIHSMLTRRSRIVKTNSSSGGQVGEREVNTCTYIVPICLFLGSVGTTTNKCFFRELYTCIRILVIVQSTSRTGSDT
jgi:hypothetical protein